MVHHLIEWAIFCGELAAVFVAFRLLSVLDRRIGRRVRRFRTGRRTGPGHWSLALLLRLDDQTGLLYPSVQIVGSRVPARAKVRLEVIDPAGVPRHTAAQRVPMSAAGREVSLPPFRCPGALVGEPLGWRWNVTLRAGRRRLAETTETLYEAGGFNDEAEIAIGG